MRYSDWMTAGRVALMSSAVMGATLVSGVAGAEESFRGTTDIKGITMSPVSVLPAAPEPAKKRESCTSRIEPKTTAGQLVAAKGWAVTGEVKVGRYTVVSFVGQCEQGGSGTEVMTQGNLGIFSDKLLAIAYTRQADDLLIGTVRKLDGGGARLYDGDRLGAPVADLRLTDAGEFTLASLAAFDPVCGRRAKVPNVFNLPIDKARKRIMDAGWKPVEAKLEEDQGYENDLHKAGVTEADGCAGTGMGYCSFEYTGAFGKLSVTTTGDPDVKKGDFPKVLKYEVTCGGAK